MRIVTGALVFDVEDPNTPRILLLQRSANDSMHNQWEFPGGGCDDEDESILHAVARELWEESGLQANHISGPVGDPHFFTSRSGAKIWKFSFAVQAKTPPEGRLMARLDPTKHQRFVWASLAEVMAKKVANIELDFTTLELVATILQAFDHLEHK
ncbi:hypothetical protein EPUS_04815 [Endocarpon pusillum Z07020]|uniref:Nudix hydrolase domain-containing protein n=1 Tax=Endocarpon pusillum (strain Z07020 / HMAS-L-300199) TaxID=1263415 RepID=U1G5Z1_ENDPU|nr:uncharacterized protein EPUS_04815 [Endocarpon pusillum Z07020]ERF72762.1 hypothetical protein EPUS_04815 [Endocarpon pusillum Z07020]